MNDPEDPHGGTVLALRRSLYGLKSSGRNWSNHLHGWLVSVGFRCRVEDYGMYTRGTGASRVVLLIFVNDLLCIAGKPALQKFQRQIDKSKGSKWDI